MKNDIYKLFVGIFFFLFFFSVEAQEKTIGLLYSDSLRVGEGYTLFAPKHYTSTYLIDNKGCVINSWNKSIYEPGQSVYLLENGNLIRACFVKGGASTGGGEGGRIEEYDWNDNLIWEFDYVTKNYGSHHDVEPLSNGNILVLAVEKKSYDECIAAGFNPNYLEQVSSKGYMLPDYVIEVEPTKPVGGNIVWEWHVWDHMAQDYDHNKDNYISDITAHAELIDVNGTGNKVHYFWNHMNSIDYNEKFDQIMLSVRGNSELWIIDHSTTSEESAGHSGGNYGKGGDLLYRWGNPLAYGAGDKNDQTLFDQHDCQWIESGCPGEGNILIFNNGLKRPDGNYSSVDEIAPPVDTLGFYSLTMGNAFKPQVALWIYMAPKKSDFFSEAISGAQRLPNGNTLIDDGVHGVFWEVTPEKEIVWEYICPVDREGPMNQGDEPELDHRGHQYNAVFKIHRYPTDYPAFKGKDLIPNDPIEIYATEIDDFNQDIPAQFTLNQNYPNPFNPKTLIVYNLSKPDQVQLKVFDLKGQEVRTLINTFQSAGHHQVTWNGTHNLGKKVSSGIYLYQLQIGDNKEIKKMILMR
jgi:hypothetical protein